MNVILIFALGCTCVVECVFFNTHSQLALTITGKSQPPYGMLKQFRGLKMGVVPEGVGRPDRHCILVYLIHTIMEGYEPVMFQDNHFKGNY